MAEFLDTGGAGEVLVEVGLVDEQVVAARLLERQTLVFAGGVHCPVEIGLGFGDRLLDLLHRRGTSAALFGLEQCRSHGVDLVADEAGAGLGRGLHAGEGRERDDDDVPVLGRRLGDELLPSLCGGAAGTGEDVGGRIPLGRFSGDLVDDVVGDHDPGLADQS